MLGERTRFAPMLPSSHACSPVASGDLPAVGEELDPEVVGVVGDV